MPAHWEVSDKGWIEVPGSDVLKSRGHLWKYNLQETSSEINWIYSYELDIFGGHDHRPKALISGLNISVAVDPQWADSGGRYDFCDETEDCYSIKFQKRGIHFLRYNSDAPTIQRISFSNC